jgi:PPOX class probable F420-dependent enzyme
MAAPSLEPFVRQWAVLLTTYRSDGRRVGTPVSIAVDEDRAFVRPWDTTGKFKRIRNNPEVEVALSTVLGKPKGPAFRARARVLEGGESAHAARFLARKHPILHGLFVPAVHRLRGNETVHMELTPLDEQPVPDLSQQARKEGSG